MTRFATLTLLLAAACPWILGACGQADPGPQEEASRSTAPSQIIDRARELVAADRLGDAVALLQDALARAPEQDDLRVTLSQALRLQGEVPAAVRALREGLRERPVAGQLAVELADVFLSLDQPEPAEQVLRSARKAGAGDGDDLAYRLGVTLARLGRFDDARDEFARAEAAGTEPIAVGYSLSMLLIQAGRWGEAVERLEGLAKLDPERVDVIRELGRARLARHGNDREVARQVTLDLDRVLSETPEDWYAFEILGDAYMVLEDYPAALFHYTEALRFGGNPPRVEDRYRHAVLAQRAADRAAGIPVAPLVEPEWEQPALPTSLEQHEGFWRRRKPR